jgi:hypothetical protein
MNQSMQPAIQHLFQVSALDSLPRERLEAFVEEYPCFGFGHYLLSRKLKAENAGHFLTVTQKTGLYFSNPFWLQWLLENSRETEDRHTPARPAIETDHGIPVEKVTEPGPPIAAETVTEPGPPIAAETVTAPDLPIPAETAAELLLDSLERAKELRESLIRMNEDFFSGSDTGRPGQPDQFQPAEEPIRDEEPPYILAEAHPDSHNGTATTDTSPAQQHEAPVQQHDDPAPAMPSTPPAAETAHSTTISSPIFEPFHTIDYFASQGIRLTIDENPTDPLGRQLKSFTDWLKVMRRLPQKEREIIPDRVAEQTIQNFAAHSIEGKEVVTETMAEVLAKQGMRERARIVYEKLSLLNPDKSAYFATKIEQLNIS